MKIRRGCGPLLLLVVTLGRLAGVEDCCAARLMKTSAEAQTAGRTDSMQWVRVSDDHRGFALAQTNGRFVPWGFNYDHDASGTLIEDYWDDRWAAVESDFQEMKDLGANVVRIHLQFARFMQAADKPNERSLRQLSRLVALAERKQLYLDITGLGCYHKQDVPAWYDELDEAGRWSAQSRFWEAIAETCAHSPSIFCYDLMNEPVVPGGNDRRDDWLGPPFAGKHFVQFITRAARGRPRYEIARQWIAQLTDAIRKHDRRHLITVGLVDWSLDRPGLTSGFIPEKIAPQLDFLCVHIYPEADGVAESIETLKGFCVGKPVIIEETFPLICTFSDMTQFLEQSQGIAAGWISFYWGKTPDEYRAAPSKTLGDAIIAKWLELFPRKMVELTEKMAPGSRGP